jgi:hypothetical protein
LYKGDPNGDGLVKWGIWQQENDKEKVLVLDASPSKADVKMSKEHLVKAQIIKEMENNLPKNDLDNLRKLFIGHFFWDY